MITLRQHIPAVAAAKRPKDLLRDSLGVLNNVRPGYYAVIIGPSARLLIDNAKPQASTIVTNDDRLQRDLLVIDDCNSLYKQLTPNKPGVNVLLCRLSFLDMLGAIPNKEDRLHIRPNGLWYYDEN